MHRFFTDESILDGKVKIYGDDYNHIKKVLRIAEDEKIEVVVLGELYIGNIEICDKYISVYNLEKISENTESKIKIHLLQCLAKGEKMDLIVQKAVELGVYDITLVNSKRCIVKFDEKKESKKIERLQKISYEASKQSKRLIVPKINELIQIKDIINFVGDNYLLVAYEEDKNISLRDVIMKIKTENSGKDIFILIGSEGGFEREEVEFLINNGAFSIGLGARILRTETAGINLLSILQYEFM
ncbi:RsmE family RNA methyltransferase [Parvimonas micra]|uniref:RsmE family RNA methyltransferase n=1 Tax=Parvimonas micra TaxID=33033 RepID=UPI0020056125|nr:RsmE family RNA methyltransferase [Parvimonas micra]MCK6129688.1 16S rRNA (uracil(1498)-N(3))-methyltransferase [Parvimonas micra]MCK6135334.1 16S rRNA (uracil(1498)-N(3))-methyltransferase [Parvimonas micra]MCK6136806.1 16S rRNA (uracil(1498)-N(3))-methyltransferase [Parvimonas micra]MCK6153333.1 16S rRNA (uracil(1498)-N(3))-methyltransferase [Parvimonas micra]